MAVNYPKVYLYSVIVFAFLLPLSRAAISFFIIFLPLIWIIEGDLKNKLKMTWDNKLLKALTLFLSFTFLSTLWSDSLDYALKTIRLYSYWFAIYVIATSIEKDHIQKILTAFLYGMLISEMIAYGVFFNLFEIKYATIENPSPFMFWIDYSVFLAMTAILLLCRLLSDNYNFKDKIFMFIFFIFTIGNLFIGLGRTGQVALVCAIIVMVFLYFKPSIKSFLISMILIGSIYSISYNISDTFKDRVNFAISDIKNISQDNYDTSLGIRTVFWMVTYDILTENTSNLIAGVGIGDYQTSLNSALKNNNYPISKITYEFMVDSHAHNQYLMVLVQTGLIGFILMLNIMYQILKLTINDEEIKKLAILFLTIYFVSCITEPLWFKQFTIALFVIFISLFVNINNQRKEIN